MKIAISNIGWTNEEEPEIAEFLQSAGIKYIELATTKRWDEPILATDAEIDEYRVWWKTYDITVVAFQSMLFSHPDYKLFEDEDNRKKTEQYLNDFITLAGKMGAGRMVFGSPKNRQIGGMSQQQAEDIAVEVFSRLSTVAMKSRTVFCIEPNATQYNCDFINNAQQGIDIVKKVNKPGFGLHLDLACMTLAGDDIASSIKNARDYLKHFHISSPMLEQVEDRSDIAHRQAARALRDIGYDGYVSIEMRPGDLGTNLDRIKKAVYFSQKIYS
jgi:D-psicose/D-tagatose/L-ribulose 3-epimerase